MLWKSSHPLLFMVCHRLIKKSRGDPVLIGYYMSSHNPYLRPRSVFYPVHSNPGISFHMQPLFIFWCRQIFKKHWGIFDGFEFRSTTDKWRAVVYLMNERASRLLGSVLLIIRQFLIFLCVVDTIEYSMVLGMRMYNTSTASRPPP